jgi:uncharacterized protein (TIGR02996 family)
MSLQQAFLADIIDHPEDDTPRLVYADWLDDNGDPDRAEFIRAQCELALKRVAGGAARRKELEKRALALFAAYGERWTKAFGDWCPASFWCWSRGFPHHVRLEPTLTAVAEQLPAITAAAPVREVFLTLRNVSAGEGAVLAACPALARLRKLELYGSLHGATPAAEQRRYCNELRLLLRSPHLRPLAEFETIQLALDHDALAPVLTMPNLHSLRLYSNQLDDQATRLICQSPIAARLTELAITEQTTAWTARSLAQTPALANLQKLDLDQGQIGDTGAKHLAGAAHLANLRFLNLYSCDIGNVGAAALAASPYLTKLRELRLSRNRVLYAGARSLAASTTLPRGMTLDLWDNEMDDYTPEIRRDLARRFRKVNYGRNR